MRFVCLTPIACGCARNMGLGSWVGNFKNLKAEQSLVKIKYYSFFFINRNETHIEDQGSKIENIQVLAYLGRYDCRCTFLIALFQCLLESRPG